jgi:WD40 repeat protein
MKKKKLALVIVAAGLVPIFLVCGLALFVYLRLRPLEPPEAPLRLWAASFSPDGKWLATAAGQSSPRDEPRVGELAVWDTATGRKKRLLRQGATARAVAWAPNGRFIAMGGFDGAAKLVGPDDGNTVALLPARPGGVNALAISADSKIVVEGGLDGTVALWEAGGKESELLATHGDQILNVAIAPDRSALVATSRSGKGFLFNLLQRGEPHVLELASLRRGGAEAVAFAPDGASFVTGCQKTLRLWETATGHQLRELAGCAARINSAAFSPDGHTLATIDGAGTLALWNPETGDLLKSIPAHADTSFCLTFSPDGKRLVTVGRIDYTIKTWDSQTLALLAAFHEAKPRSPRQR